MRNLIITLIFIYVSATGMAQTYKGKVKDANGSAVPFANVMLYSLPDSTFVTGVITNDSGDFLLKSNKKVTGYLEISFIGYKTVAVPAEENAGIIVLKEAASELGEVVVKAQLPKMQVKDDAFVTTIQNSVLAKAGTADNVLQRLPMLTGKDGIYTVFGKGQAKIYINNREMRDALELENLNSDDIKSVDIVTNPGARYDASIKAVIRIYTIKRSGDGFSFDVRSSYYQSENIDLIEKININYRKKGWDIFGRLSYKDINSVEENDITQTTYVDTIWKQQNASEFLFHSKYIDVTGGINYEISQKHFAGIKYTYGTKTYGQDESELNSIIYADSKLYDKWTTSGLTKHKSLPKHIVNVYYNGTFGKLDINFDVAYFSKKEGSEDAIIEQSRYFEDRIVNSKRDLDNRMFASKLVLTYPVFKGKLSVGNEYSVTDRDDNYWADQIAPSAKTRIEQESSSFFAEYARNTELGKFSMGLRYEHTQADYFVNGVFKPQPSKIYNQWFPSFSFSTKIKNLGLEFSYTSKTNRPTYRQLSNNIFYLNRFTMQTGNPFLNPSVTHDISLSGNWKFLQLMLSYKYEKDAVIYWTEQMESNPAVSIIRYKNLDKLPHFAAFVGISPTIGIWSPQLSGGIKKQWLKLESNSSFIHLNKLLPFVSFNNSFRLPEEFVFTFDASCQGKGDVQNIYLSENIIVVNTGLTKSFFDNRLNVSLKGYDIFNGKKVGNLLYNSQMQLYTKNSFDTREFEITVRYKFNSAKSKYKGKGAGKSEIDRL